MNTELTIELTIANAAAALKDLKKCLKESKDLVVDLSGVEKIDLSGIQLLISAQNTGNKSKRTLYYSGNLSDSVSEKLFCSGFMLVPSEDNSDLFTIRRSSGEF